MLVTLLPQALGVTIPMALLLGILIGLGRLSADREFVALQACGVSIFRLLRPIALLAVVACAATAYVMIVALPNANQTFREITFNVVAARAEGDVKPRVFFEPTSRTASFTCATCCRRAAGATCSWPTNAQRTRRRCICARTGRLVIDRAEADRAARAGERDAAHDVSRTSPRSTKALPSIDSSCDLDPDAVFPSGQTLLKGDNEMTIAELQASIAEAEKTRWTRLQPALHDPAEVLDSGRMSRPCADRTRARCRRTARTAGWRASCWASA